MVGDVGRAAAMATRGRVLRWDQGAFRRLLPGVMLVLLETLGYTQAPPTRPSLDLRHRHAHGKDLVAVAIATVALAEPGALHGMRRSNAARRDLGIVSKAHWLGASLHAITLVDATQRNMPRCLTGARCARAYEVLVETMAPCIIAVASPGVLVRVTPDFASALPATAVAKCVLAMVHHSRGAAEQLARAACVVHGTLALQRLDGESPRRDIATTCARGGMHVSHHIRHLEAAAATGRGGTEHVWARQLEDDVSRSLSASVCGRSLV